MDRSRWKSDRSVVTLLVGIISIWKPADLRKLRYDVRTGRVLGVQFSVHRVPLSRIVMIHTQIKDALIDVWGQKPCSPHIQTGNRHFNRFLTLTQELHKCGEIPWILTHSILSHVWRIGSLSSLEQHHRCHSAIFDHCAFGTPWKLRTKLVAGYCDYQDILPLAEYSVINFMFVLSVAVLTSNNMAKISLDDSLQHVAKFSPLHLCSKLCDKKFPKKLEKDTPLLLTSKHPILG